MTFIGEGEICIADVLLPVPVEGTFSYSVPAGLPVQVGQLVEAPFRRAMLTGVVVSLNGRPVPRLRPLQRSLPLPCLKPEVLRFLQWVADYTLTPVGLIFKMMLPADILEAEPVRHGLRLVNPMPSSMRVTPPRQRVLAVFQAAGEAPFSRGDLIKQADVSASVVDGLLQAGILAQEVMLPQTLQAAQVTLAAKPSLNLEQRAAVEALASSQGHQITVLDGVTGSGKTEVYFELIERMLAAGLQTLVMLPEIALSSQWLERFQRRFGFVPVVWHSDIAPLQKRQSWREVLTGQARVVVGARSSLFLPFARLGLIIVDEEHDGSYKQEESVIYNARDMAVVRAKLEGIPLVLASATPSLETMENVQSGRYAYVKLPQRFGESVLPTIHLVDMREEKRAAQSWVSAPLRRRMEEALAAGEQSMLFLNRRGYAPVTLCRGCGYRFMCPTCSAWLVKHKHRDHLQCHHCGHEAVLSAHCPACGEADTLLPCGPGVERIADEVYGFLPQARVLVMSSDALPHVGAVNEAIRQIQAGEVDVIVGTQVVAKGHDFPALTCVGVVDADLGLVGSDLRAGERTFQMLMQVAGRAGRHAAHGHVVLQTFDPQHPLMQALARGDREGFLAKEREERRAFSWPPFGRLVGLVLSSSDERLVESLARYMVAKAPKQPAIGILGPAPAPLYKIRGKFRWRILVKAQKTEPVQAYLAAWLRQIRWPKTVKLQVDIDPMTFL